MIQGHVFDAVLSTGVKAHRLYYLHDFFHGFVAPAFLFASGIAFGVSTMKRWEEHITWSNPVRSRVRRFLGLIAIGYALHLPYFSLRKTLSTASADQLKSLFQSDVLQCVGVTLLLLQIGVLLVKDRKAFTWAAAGAAALIILVSPLTWSARFSDYLPVAIASYLSPENGSWFPLFPWAAYLVFGAVAGAVVANYGKPDDLALMLKGGALSLGILFVAWAAMYLPFEMYPAHDFWKSNPTMFLVRLGAVGVVASCIFVVGYGLKWSQSPPRTALIIGRESLFIYILHLLFVYGSVLNRGLAQRVGPTLSLLEAIGAFALVFALVALIAALWHKLKTDHKTVASGVAAAGAVTFLAGFVIRAW